MANLSRRVFLKASLGAGASFVLGAYLTGCESAAVAEPTLAPAPAALLPTPAATALAAPTLAPAATTLAAAPTLAPALIAEPTLAPATASFTPGVFLRIENNDIVTIIVSRSEMGQGVRTSFPMIVAEELDADWSKVRIEQAATDDKYGRLNTFGSRSIISMWDILRQSGATARAMLVAAAAQTWGVDSQELATENGVVVHHPTGRRLAYGQLVETAAQLPAPEQVALKDPRDFRIIGTPQGQQDASHMIDGSAIYGIDVRLPGMRYAVVARSPVFGGRLVGYDAAPALALDGVRHVVAIEGAVAVVADTTWAAMRGRAALRVTWDDGQHAQLSSTRVRQALRQSLPDVRNQSAQPADRLEAIYEVPYYAHATMEPMNCVADVRADRCDVWAPTQAPQSARDAASHITGLPPEAVTVHVTLMGMGLGRRSATDFVGEAVQVSKAIGAPAQVLWTREDDMQHDFYHPTSVHYLRANVDPAAEIEIQTAGGRGSGAIPTGAWRSVNNFPQAFIRESFVDELAAALGRDPYELRLQRLTQDAHKAVLELAASKAGWGRPLPAGSGRGIAFYIYGEGRGGGSGTYVAQVVEASVAADGSVRVDRVVCAVDCGIPINPAMITAQVEGGIVHALSATLKSEITVEGGRVQQSNFDDYPLLRLNEMPAVEVHIVPSTRSPQGMGEMGVPTLAPALANAIFSATGKRIRRLPIRPEDM